jgi:hypothetical protein
MHHATELCEIERDPGVLYLFADWPRSGEPCEHVNLGGHHVAGEAEHEGYPGVYRSPSLDGSYRISSAFTIQFCMESVAARNIIC